MLRLTQYHMDVEYMAGRYLFLSDCLSRMSNPVPHEEDGSLNLQVKSILNDDVGSRVDLIDVKQALVGDPVSVLLGDLILNGWPDSCKELEDELKPYWIHGFNLSLVDGVILLGEECIVVPVSLCGKIPYSITLYQPMSH